MSNKQNYPFQYDSVYHTQGPKPRHRYPLKDMDDDFNSIQIPPAIKFSNKNKLSLHMSQSSNQKQFLNYNKSQLALSIKQKYRAMHINSIHGLIGSTREKKQQIEDLLKKQQQKAYYQDLDQNQISASLRKLKKVVRLMEIVCKIILGKNEQNNYIDLSSQQDIIIHDMHSISMENFQKQVHSKDREIERLKKLVNILSIPDQKKSNHSSSCKDSFTVNNSINSEKQAQIELQMKQEIDQKAFISVDVQTDIEKKQFISMEIQTQPQQKLRGVDSSVQYEKQISLTSNIINSITQTELEISASILNLQTQEQRKQKKLAIVQEFSIWNILDANIKDSESDNEQIMIKIPLQTAESTLKQQIQYEKSFSKRIQNQSFFVQTQAQLNYLRQFSTQTQNETKLGKSISYEIKIDSKSPFLKRYKSIVKVAISCLNLCNNVFVRAYQREQNTQIHGQIQKLSEHFNKEYHQLGGRYKDQFCKQIRQQMNIIYDKIYKIYLETKKNPLFLQQLQ